MVTGAGAYSNNIGGIVGQNNGTISGCSAEGTVTGNGSNVGEIAGINTPIYDTGIGSFIGSTIEGCYSTVDVSGQFSVGGVVGTNSQGTVTGCYHTTGSIISLGGDRIGGIAGYNNQSTFTACYWENNQGQGIGDNQADTTIETTKIDDTTTWMQAKKAMNNALQDLTT